MHADTKESPFEQRAEAGIRPYLENCKEVKNQDETKKDIPTL